MIEGIEVRELPGDDTWRAHLAVAELRPHVGEDRDAFVSLVERQLRPAGYRLFATFAVGDDHAAAVAGFRPIRSLAWGDVLYVDDLSTRAAHRGRGHASALLDAVAAEARRVGSDAVHLDSGHHRYDAHRRYLAAGYQIRSHHFVLPLG